jgi:hypothetical protein
VIPGQPEIVLSAAVFYVVCLSVFRIAEIKTSVVSIPFCVVRIHIQGMASFGINVTGDSQFYVVADVEKISTVTEVETSSPLFAIGWKDDP